MKTTMNSLVSVIMPVYNAEVYVGLAITSVLQQSYSNIELLIINDGSNDKSEEVILKSIANDSRVKYFKQKNTGVSAARNVGLRNMTGVFFCFLDADDIFPVNSIELRMRKFSANPDLAFCDGAVTTWDANFEKQQSSWKPTHRGSAFEKLTELSESCFFGLTWLIKRDDVMEYRFQEDMTHAEDLLFFIEISRSGNYDFIDDPVLLYRASQKSAMRNLNGLAVGYNALYDTIVTKFGGEMTMRKKLYLFLRIRTIMVLSFLRAGSVLNALYFLILGRPK